MKNFNYHLPKTKAEVVALLLEGGRVKSGGTDLVPLMKSRITEPEDVVAIHRLPEWAGIKHGDSDVWIGATTTITDIADDAELRRFATALTEAADKTATPLVRNRATLGGNLCQRPRCWYFRHEDYQCLKRGGSMCYAQEGENKYHAIFNNNMCAIVHPSNLAPALMALDAVVHLSSSEGDRTLPIERFWARPESSIMSEVRLREGEMVTAVTFDKQKKGVGSAYIEVREKQSYDWALVCTAARIDLDGKKVKGSRIVVSAVAPTPLRRKAAEDVLEGETFTEALAWEAAEAAVQDHRALRDNTYKVRMLKACVAHSLIQAFERASV